MIATRLDIENKRNEMIFIVAKIRHDFFCLCHLTKPLLIQIKALRDRIRELESHTRDKGTSLSTK